MDHRKEHVGILNRFLAVSGFFCVQKSDCVLIWLICFEFLDSGKGILRNFAAFETNFRVGLIL